MAVAFVFCAAMAIGSPAQTSTTLTTLHSFNNTDGASPYAGLVQGTDGKLYGTTFVGGVRYGTVFRITTVGALTTLHSFNITDGENPEGGLVQAIDGNFYGTTVVAGAHPSYGTVFKITPGGTLTTLHSFDYTDGYYPEAGLVLATNGNFYGTTYSGGSDPLGGTVFRITAAGTLTTLHSFTTATGGYHPAAGLVQGIDGNFYGTTVHGGAHGGNGTIFKIAAGGALTTLHSFDFTDGSEPEAGLVQATDGNFYGTTSHGGANNVGTVFKLSVGLGPFVETEPTSGRVGMGVLILGNNLTGASSVTFNGKAATFTVVSASEIRTTVPTGATTGKVKVTTPGRTLISNVNFRVS
jgi:uncharacterized repeat protein (TIGR03803 family)